MPASTALSTTRTTSTTTIDRVSRPSRALLLVLLLAACAGSSRDEAGDTSSTRRSTTTTVASSTSASSTTAAPTTTTTAPTTTTPPTTQPPPPPPRFTRTPYRGLGSWLDVYDWTDTYSSKGPLAGPADVERMADLGVDTLYLQASRFDRPEAVVEPTRFRALVDRAHDRRMRVVAWYLPTLEDVGKDVQRMLAIARQPVDGLAVDIESTAVQDPAERSRRLVLLTTRLRAALPSETLGAIVLPPVVTDVLNKKYWPGFPWRELQPLYDVWLPMAYWTNRTGEWRDAERYVDENVRRVRDHLGRGDAVVHAVGGIGDDTTVADVQGMRRATTRLGTIGASLYDYRTTGDALWPALVRFSVRSG